MDPTQAMDNAGPSEYTQGYPPPSNMNSAPQAVSSSRGDRQMYSNLIPNSPAFGGHPQQTPPFYRADGLPRHEYSGNVNGMSSKGQNIHRPLRRGFGRGKGRGFADRHQPPNNTLYHQPPLAFIPPAAYPYPPPQQMQNFPPFPQQLHQMPYTYPGPHPPFPPSTSIHEQILKSPDYDQLNGQSVVPQNDPPISPNIPFRSQNIVDPAFEQVEATSSPDTQFPPLAPQVDAFDGSVPVQDSLPEQSVVVPDTNEPPPRQEWVIAPFRPDNPADAFGIIISPRAKPPSHIVSSASEFRMVEPSPKPSSITLHKFEDLTRPQLSNHAPQTQASETHASEAPMQSSEPISSSTTETESGASSAPDAFVPGSPVSSNTSISVPPAKVVATDEPTSTGESSARAASPASFSGDMNSFEGAPVQAASPVKKSWASLLQATGAGGNQLPTSKVVGFSVSAAQEKASTFVTSPGSNELSRLLSSNFAQLALGAGGAPQIRPRGLVNTGNMCFANAVLQVLVYCPPFYRLFTELGKYFEKVKSKQPKSTPLVDATIDFLKEFGPSDKGRFSDGYGSDEFDGIDSFIPSNIYDAMKESKRFDHMGGGQQEDAEEFFGFFMDSLEEELLTLVNPDKSKPSETVSPQQAASGDDGWVEVGKKNKQMVTRSSKSANSPISRIFGGKLRSIVKVPGQRDSAVLEDWRSVRLDIQREQTSSIEDALRSISHPQQVQVSSVIKGGASVDATQQILVESLPPILVLHLKRFHYDTSSNGVVKIGKQVAFGPVLAIPAEVLANSSRSAPPTKYKLYAVVYHHGHSAAGGHYTVDVLHPNRGGDLKAREGWIRIDDELVSDLREEDVFGTNLDNRCAYLLFYRRLPPGPRMGH